MNQPARACSVLFICTGNCCRSQMAEALLRHMGGPRFLAQSAGTDPAGYVHPLVIEAARRLEIPIQGQFSKSWMLFKDQPQDAIITLCDVAACRPPPEWAGRPARAHWSLADPSFMPGSQEQRIQAAMAMAEQLRRWLTALIELPVERLTPAQLEAELQRIGET